MLVSQSHSPPLTSFNEVITCSIQPQTTRSVAFSVYWSVDSHSHVGLSQRTRFSEKEFRWSFTIWIHTHKTLYRRTVDHLHQFKPIITSQVCKAFQSSILINQQFNPHIDIKLIQCDRIAVIKSGRGPEITSCPSRLSMVLNRTACFRLTEYESSAKIDRTLTYPPRNETFQQL